MNISALDDGGFKPKVRQERSGGESQTRQALSEQVPQALVAPQAVEARVQSRPANATSSNSMSHNFASAEREQSKYLKAALTSLKVDQQMEDQQQNTLTSILQSAKMEYESATTFGKKYKALKIAERKLNWHQATEVRKYAEETHLKKSKEDLEEKAQEAIAAQDENGNPIEKAPVESAGKAAPRPEIFGSDTALAPNAGISPAPEATAGTPTALEHTQASEIAAPSAQTRPAIDITV